MSNYSIVALGSGQGSTIEFFCKKILLEKPNFKIKALITDKASSGMVGVAKKYNLPCHVVEYKGKDFNFWDEELCQAILAYEPQLILLAGFVKKIGTIVLSKFKNKIINSHPSLLPEFSGLGMYGLKVHQAVIQEKKSYTGVSIHIVNQNYDEGPILAQKKIPVQTGETAVDLEKKVKALEKQFYFETIVKILQGKISLN